MIVNLLLLVYKHETLIESNVCSRKRFANYLRITKQGKFSVWCLSKKEQKGLQKWRHSRWTGSYPFCVLQIVSLQFFILDTNIYFSFGCSSWRVYIAETTTIRNVISWQLEWKRHSPRHTILLAVSFMPQHFYVVMAKLQYSSWLIYSFITSIWRSDFESVHSYYEKTP